MQPVGSIRPPVDRRLFELLKANTPAVEPQDTVESGAFRVRDSKPGVALLRMAKMHKRQPEWNSLQVQSYVSEHLCVTMDGVRALDPRAANRFLRS